MNRKNLRGRDVKPIDCNAELLRETQVETKEDMPAIKSAISFYGEFIAEKITEGAYEGVSLPYFGKFQIKTRELQRKAHAKGRIKDTD